MWRLFGAIFWQLAWAVTFVVINYQFKLNFEVSFAFLAGALVGGLIGLIVNLNNSRQFLNWLRSVDEAAVQAPKLMGVWGEATERVKRLLNLKARNLETSNQRLEDFLAAIQASPNGVVLLDKNGQIEWCNLTAASHFGLNPSKDISQYLVNLVRDPDFKTYLATEDFSNAVLIAGKTIVDNRPSKLSVHIHPYGQGKKLLLSNDVTAIEAAESMRRDFVANVSHEIRTPLTVLSGFVETMQSLELNDQDHRKYLDLMAQQSLRMQSLVSDLLTLSKLEASAAPQIETWVSVDGLADACKVEAFALRNSLYENSNQDIHSSEIGSAETYIQFDIQPKLEVACASAELLSAMCNLVNNAVRYTPPNKKIRISFQSLDRGGAIFSVIDSGAGIATEHLPRLTERFYRVDASRSRESGGTGLGLAIVKHVVQRHGGELKISSALGQGSTFCFTLPDFRVRLR